MKPKNNWEFRCNLERNLNNNQLRKCSMNLHLHLKNQQKSGIDDTELINEIISFKNIIPVNS